MSWARITNRRLGLCALISIAVLLVGCASNKTSTEEAAAAEAEAREEALQIAFETALQSMEAGNPEAAESQFEQIHEGHPERTGPLANLGILAFEGGKKGKAVGYFEKVIALDPDHVVALNYLGVLARERGEFDVAEQYYRQALAEDADYLPSIMNLAILLDIYLGRPAEALPLYERYQAATEGADPRLKDWIFDVKNRM